MGVQDPEGEITYITAAFPSACGKTNLAMLESALPGYKIWTLGDDIAWMNVGPDGRLYAINPEAGFFGVAPGTSIKTNPNMVRTLKAAKFYPTLFTNVGLDLDKNEPWWEGADGPVPRSVARLAGQALDAGRRQGRASQLALHRLALQRPDAVQGVRQSARACPSRRSFWAAADATVPLVAEAFDWEHGVFMGARTGSETTAAAAGKVGVLRRDPMAMLPFCGYNMGDYFGHWLEMGKRIKHPPKILRRQLVPHGRGRASSSGRASARTSASSSGCWTARTTASAPRKRPSAWCPTPTTWTFRPEHAEGQGGEALRDRPRRAGRKKSSRSTSSSASSATTCRPASAASATNWPRNWGRLRVLCPHASLSFA